VFGRAPRGLFDAPEVFYAHCGSGIDIDVQDDQMTCRGQGGPVE
jgi:hypothetical protein